MDPITPQKSLMEITAERIRNAIFRGELQLGAKLSEQKLADMLEISRSPVREALALLQIEGLVRVLPKRGTFVFTPDTKTVTDLCDHRAILEAACIKFALQRNPETLIAKLRHEFEQMQFAIRSDDSHAYSKSDMQFHQAIIECSENSSILKVYQTTIGPLMALRTHLFTIMKAQYNDAMAQHAALLDACAQGDVVRAQVIAAKHIQHLAEHYRLASSKDTPPGLAVVR